jgi:hypothetical protein
VRITLRIIMAILGVSAVLICASILILGAQSTAWGAERVFGAFTGHHAGLSEPWPATMDSELRFYAPFWGAYGVILLITARELPTKGNFVPLLAAMFFAGGVGRALSYFQVGAPHPFFVLLMVIELVTPTIMLFLWFGTARRRL